MPIKIAIGLTLSGAALLCALNAAPNQPNPETVRLIHSIQGPNLYRA